jgi:glutamate-ammonia-ligase adenylyltransferase
MSREHPPIPTRLPIPEELRETAACQYAQYREAAAEAGVRAVVQVDLVAVLQRVFAASEFVAESCIRHPDLLADLLITGDLLADYAPAELPARLIRALAATGDEAELALRLRQLRRREMVRIAWRDLAGWAGLDEVLRDLTDLAEGCVQGALQPLHRWLAKQYGEPRDRQGRPLALVVLGMGKLGAGELNFSSDIDLIFAYREEGETRRRNGLGHEEFFTRLGRQLIQALDEATGEGFVFRVDMRLRPFGASGPLAIGFGALEEYYQSQGREWERYAMIKARPIAGDPAEGAELMELLRPFVYRRYLDFSAFESLRDLKVQIEREIERKGHQDNIKLGPGGIREVEFIGQAFQLVRGGREKALRRRELQVILPTLAELDLLPGYIARSLVEAYRFLRRTENRLQMVRDGQVHRLPADGHERLRLAFAMGYADWAAFERDLRRHRRLVHEHFQQVFAAPQVADGGTAKAGGDELDALCTGADPAVQEEVLRRHGFTDPEETARWLENLRDGSAMRFAGQRGRAQLRRLLPLLLHAAAEQEQSDATFARLAQLLEAIAGRTTYLTLLLESPMALSQLVRLCGASPWLADMLASHPVLLDELLDPRALYQTMARETLERELEEQFRALPPDDLEQQMDALRHFQQMAVLHVAAADITGALPLMIVSDELTEIAEVVLRKVLQIAWAIMVGKHGEPGYRRGRRRLRAGFCIIAYGKLGGIELGYGSDLDLVFLHDGAGDEQHTDGARSIHNEQFFARLGQRIIHMLETLTPAGVLYEVDMRLRPSGAAGQLVPNVEAFADYQQQEAWTWEHQALVRARPVAGDPAIAERFAAIRRAVLSRPRERGELRTAVRDMRARMRQELGSRASGRFDLKQDPGGIADIEFMVQYGLLAWSHDRPELLEYTDNMRLLDGFGRAGLLPMKDVACLQEAYKAFRARVHRLSLQGASADVDEGEFTRERACVSGIWRRLMEGDVSG